jgi:2-polyprenyl-3-methyl-5-hydroxy-6-metoxy-1,4-benzoquinol methylase
VSSTTTAPICPACGAPGKDRHYEIEHYDLFKCAACRTEFLVPSSDREPVEHTFWDDYKFEIYGDDKVQAAYEALYDRVFEQARRYTSGIHHVLDVGCGIGNFLDWVRTRGMDGLGVDVEQGAIDSCRERGLDAVLLDQLEDRVEPGSLDMVTMWDVIEHVQDPSAVLQQLVPLLRPGGVMAFETPDVAFPVRPAVIAIRKVAEPIRWSDMLYYAEHRVYFSSRGLSTLLARCDLDVVDQVGMRSPSAKMANSFQHWADRGAGAGRLGPHLYRGLDWSMRRVGMTNKLIMVGRTSPTPP